jgi:hypothetical protein
MFLMPPQPARAGKNREQEQDRKKIADPAPTFGCCCFQNWHAAI